MREAQSEIEYPEYIELLRICKLEFLSLKFKQILPFWKKRYKKIIAFFLAVAITMLFYSQIGSKNVFVALMFLLVLGNLSMAVLLPIIRYILAPLLFNILYFLYKGFILVFVQLFLGTTLFILNLISENE